jgi:hypothetical protein
MVLFSGTADSVFADVSSVIFLRPYKIGEQLLTHCVAVGGPCGIVDMNGQEVVAPQFNAVLADEFATKGKMQFKAKFESGWGIFDSTGKWLAQPINRQLYFFRNDYAVFRAEDGLMGYLASDGTVAISAQFKYAEEFGTNFAPVSLPNASESDIAMWGLIDRNGKFVVEQDYKTILPFAEGFAQFSKADRIGYLDESGKEVFSGPYVMNQKFSEGFASVLTHAGEAGLINRKGEWIVTPKHEIVNDVSEGLAGFLKQGAWGFLDTNGQVVIKAQFDNVRKFSEGIAAARKGRKFGYINRDGKWQIKPKFDDAEEFEGGVAPVNLGGKDDDGYGLIEGGLWGAIDENGKWVVKPKYKRVYVNQNVIVAYDIGKKLYFSHDGALVSESAMKD